MRSVSRTVKNGSNTSSWGTTPSMRRAGGQQAVHAVQTGDRLQRGGKVAKGDFLLARLGVAQPGEEQREERGIHFGDFAEIDALHAFLEMAPAFLEQASGVGQGHRPAHDDAAALPPDHFFGAVPAASNVRFFALRLLTRPSIPDSRTVLLNSVR